MKLARLAFALLLVGELIQLGTVLAGGAVYPGYDHARQYISELGATGAVTGPAVSWWGFVPSGLSITAFGLIATWLMRRSAPVCVACVMLARYGLRLSVAVVYPLPFARERAEVSVSSQRLFFGFGNLSS